MKLVKVYLKNFRGYANYTEIDFDNITTLVGENDIGKSTILEALDIFFNDNNGLIKIDKNDINVTCKRNGDLKTVIGCIFSDLPKKLVIDSSVNTDLTSEYMVNKDGYLDIKKIYENGSSKCKVFMRAFHPTNPSCSDLLNKKQKELQTLIKNEGIACVDCTCNSIMRKAIWNHYFFDLKKDNIDIDITKGDTKGVWEQLKMYIPIYNLFQADRKNSDSDSEIQDPLKMAVKEVMNEPDIMIKLNEIAETVRERLDDVSKRTIDKLQDMNPSLSNELVPNIPETSSLKWTDVFKNVSISGDEGIPINKRGSGFKRLVLLSFFRAEAERKIQSNNHASVIYAFEEPECSQHWDNQRILIESFNKLSCLNNVQVILTTHSPDIVKHLKYESLRLITDNGCVKKCENVSDCVLKYKSLNEINYIAFGMPSEGYHDELYSYITLENRFNDFASGKPTLTYKRDITRKGKVVESIKDSILSQYIRDQIHHPENTKNIRYSNEQLKKSIEVMREFIKNNM